jgi:CheY-like chemotaxis protein
MQQKDAAQGGGNLEDRPFDIILMDLQMPVPQKIFHGELKILKMQSKQKITTLAQRKSYYQIEPISHFNILILLSNLMILLFLY